MSIEHGGKRSRNHDEKRIQHRIDNPFPGGITPEDADDCSNADGSTRDPERLPCSSTPVAGRDDERMKNRSEEDDAENENPATWKGALRL